MNYLPYRDGESKTEPMNELEKEIYNNLVSHENITEGQNPLSALVCKGHSKVAAAIALKWIQKALRDTSEHTFTDSKGKLMRKVQDVYVAAWMEENGLKTPEV